MSTAVINHHEAAQERFLLSSLRLLDDPRPSIYRPAEKVADPSVAGEQFAREQMAPLFSQHMASEVASFCWWGREGNGSAVALESQLIALEGYEANLKKVLVACGLRPYDGPRDFAG